MTTSVGLVVAGLASGTAAIAGLALGSAGIGLAQPMNLTIGQEIAGPRAAAQWMGIQNMLGNLAGVAAPIATGLLVDATGAYASAFGAALIPSVAGLVCWTWLVGRVGPVSWPETPGR